MLKLKVISHIRFQTSSLASPPTRSSAVYLEDNIRLPHTHKIIFGGTLSPLLPSPYTHHLALGSHDNGYVNVLRSVITEGFRDKLILIPGYSEVALDIKALMLPELRIPDLFISTKLAPASYTSIASGPPPGLLARISNSSITSVTPAPAPTDIPNSTPGRNSFQSYKTAAQTGRNDYEASDSSASTDANDAQSAQPFHWQFTNRVSSPGKQRRLNPKLVEFILLSDTRLTELPTLSALVEAFVDPHYAFILDSHLWLQITPHLAPCFIFNSADMDQTADTLMTIYSRKKTIKNSPRMLKRLPARLPTRVRQLSHLSHSLPSHPSS